MSYDLFSKGSARAEAAPAQHAERTAGKETVVQRMARVQPAAESPAERAAGEPVRAPSWAAGEDLMAAFGLASPPVQRKGAGAGEAAQVSAAAERGVSGGGRGLPHGDVIQRAFGAHDVSDVRAHTGGAASEACDQIGATAYATGRNVAFASSTPDLHTAAHEAAHVVQQRAGVQLLGGVGQANDRYEQHADRVAELVVRGESAQGALDEMAGGSGGGTHSAVQRFGSREHQSLGDNATGGATYDMGGHSPAIDASEYNRAFRLTHGDIVMLSGDFFSPRDTRPTSSGGTEPNPDSLFLLAGIPSTSPGQNAGTWDEVVYAIKKAIPNDPRFGQVCTAEWPTGHPWGKVQFSAAVTEAVDARYLRLAAGNDEHFVAPTGTDRGPTAGDGASAGGSYRAQHEAAIGLAYDQGNAAAGNAREAGAQHYLTDHFAAGHLRTPRGSIRSHWRAVYPNFWTNIRNKIALDVSIWINDHDPVGNVATVDTIFTGVQTTVNQETANIPAMGFDDLVSLVAHDYDNENGLWVLNDLGDHWKLFGDGALDNPDPANRTREIAQEAVALGVADIEHAASQGASRVGTPMTRPQLYDHVRSVTGGRAQPNPDKYGPEQLLPRPDEARAAENGTQNWQRANLEELWTAPVHSGTAATFGSEIEASMQGGELNHELAGMAEKFPEEQTVDFGFVVHPRRGFLDGFLAPLVANPRAGLDDVINFSPSRGQAGFNEDDAIMREINGGENGAGAAPEAELRGMTIEQRVTRIRALISGSCAEDEGAVVVRLFSTARPADRRVIYERIEGHPWEGDFRSGVFTIDDDLHDALTNAQLTELRALIGS